MNDHIFNFGRGGLAVWSLNRGEGATNLTPPSYKRVAVGEGAPPLSDPIVSSTLLNFNMGSFETWPIFFGSLEGARGGAESMP